MAHWGISYAAGPNYNLPWHRYDPAGKKRALEASYDAMQRALAAAPNASPVEQALIRALPARYPQREVIEDQTTWDKAFTVEMRKLFRAHPPRSRPALGLCRGDHERDAVADVGSQDRPADAGRRHGGGGRGAGERLPRHSRELGPSRPAAPLRPSDGDVAVPAAGAARRRPAARPRARLRPSCAHADPYRCAVRQLSRRRRLQPESRGGRPQVSRPRGRPQRLFDVSQPRPSLHRLRRHVPRPVHAGHHRGAG